MNLKEHAKRDDMKVWLSEPKVERLLAKPTKTQRRIGSALAASCGLRSLEILQVAPEDVVDTDAWTMLRIWEGKGDQFRETPMPTDLAASIGAIDDYRDAPLSTSLVEISSTRSLRRWIDDATAQLARETGDDGWRYLSMHDLRRTWATSLSDANVDPLLALEWGGWNDLETFLDHYKGPFSPEAQAREREKVDWL